MNELQLAKTQAGHLSVRAISQEIERLDKLIAADKDLSLLRRHKALRAAYREALVLKHKQPAIRLTASANHENGILR